MLPPQPVSSYLTFSPLSSEALAMADGYFLLHCYTLADIFPLGSMVPFVARTFLSANSTTMERPAARQSYKFTAGSGNISNFAGLPAMQGKYFN
jgi:hypothetical protein